MSGWFRVLRLRGTEPLPVRTLTKRLIDPFLCQSVEGAPRFPRCTRPFPNALDMLLRVLCPGDVDDRQAPSFSCRRCNGSIQRLGPVQPALNSFVDCQRVLGFKYGVHAREMGGKGLAGTHVFLGMLQRVGVDRQPVDPTIPVVAELLREHLVEKSLATFLTLRNDSPALAAVREFLLR